MRVALDDPKTFVSLLGRILPREVQAEVPRLCKRAGRQRRLPKDLRDTFASQLLSAGFPQVQIMRWMGHAPGSVSMFRKRYAKWIGGENDWSYRAPLQLEPGEVPTDIFERLLQGCCQLLQAKEHGDRSP